MRQTRAVAGRKIVPWIVGVMTISATVAISALVYNLQKTSQTKPVPFAVLPFTDESAARDQAYFCDGVSEELSARFGLFPALRVVHSNSVFRLRGQEAGEIVKQLQLEAILQGSIRKENGRLRVQVRLSRIAESAPLWEHTYDEAAGTEVEIEDKIVREAIRRMKAGFVRAVRSTRNPEAHDFYLRGRAELRGPGAMSSRAIEFFKQAIAKDTQYPLALAGLAQAYGLTEEARAAALQSLTYDESVGAAHIALAKVLMWTDADWPTAEKELGRARTLTPQNPETYQLLATIHALRGKKAEAAEMIARALDLDPLSPRAYDTQAGLLLMARDYAGAVRAARRAVELDPNFWAGGRTLCRALVLSGTFDEGIATDAWALAMTGRAEEARRELGRLLALPAPPALEIARVYAALGDPDAAFQWLDRLAPQRGFAAAIVSPEWDKLRADPRYAALLTKIGLGPKQ